MNCSTTFPVFISRSKLVRVGPVVSGVKADTGTSGTAIGTTPFPEMSLINVELNPTKHEYISEQIGCGDTFLMPFRSSAVS